MDTFAGEAGDPRPREGTRKGAPLTVRGEGGASRDQDVRPLSAAERCTAEGDTGLNGGRVLNV